MQQKLNSKCQAVRDSCSFVMQQAKHVQIDQQKLVQFAEELINKGELIKKSKQTQTEKPEKIIDYLFVVDSLNFCYWPDNDWESHNMASSIQAMIDKDENVFQPKNLINIDRDFVKNQIFQGKEFPLIDERLRILKEIGSVTLQHFDGQFINILHKAQKSAVNLLYILTSYYNNFQDHCLYKGNQICFYKRSQLLISDLYAALDKQSPVDFYDMDQLTIFADYRIPQILKEFNILKYSSELTDIILQKKLVESGSEYELEIRASIVVCAENLKDVLKQKGIDLDSHEIDYILWFKGESLKDQIFPHHRTLSIYY